MFSIKSMLKGLRAPMWLMVFAILMSFVVPSVLAQPADAARKLDSSSNAELAYNIEAYFALVDYNEPSNPYIVLNYYYENGSHIRMIFGIEKDVSPSLNLNYQNNVIQVFDKKGKLDGYGVGIKSKSKVFIYIPV